MNTKAAEARNVRRVQKRLAITSFICPLPFALWTPRMLWHTDTMTALIPREQSISACRHLNNHQNAPRCLDPVIPYRAVSVVYCSESSLADIG